MHYKNLGETSFLSTEEIANQIKNGDTVAVGGFWFVRLPMALINALIKRNVKDLTIVTQASGLAVDQLVSAGLVKKVIYSFISLDLFGLAPAFRYASQKGEIEFEEWTALQMNNALKAGSLGLPYGILQPPEGSDFDKTTDYYQTSHCPFTGQKIGMIKALRPDVALIHAQEADKNGNVAIFGSLGIDQLYIGASDKTFVSVEKTVESNAFTQDSRAHIFPHFLISAICEQPGGAHPTSCIPYYTTDYDVLMRNDLNISKDILNERIGLLNCYAQMDYATIKSKLSMLPDCKSDSSWSVDELMVCLMAEQLRDHMVTTVGSNTPIAMVAYMLAKGTHAPKCTIIPFCGMVDIPYGPISLAFAEPLAYHASTTHWAIEDLWQWIYQKSLTAVEFGGCAQLDQFGNINNSQIKDAQGNLKVLLPGQAGLADILNLHHNAYYYITKHEPRRICELVSYMGGSYRYVTSEERTQRGLADGVMRVISDLCVMELDKSSRRLKVVQIHPGVTKQQICNCTGFDISFDDSLTVTKVPTREQLYMIRHEIDPFGYRRIEFLNGDERNALIKRILEQEHAL
ncbi:CoA-transferase [Oscillospiraceae bacterium PP1C4]